MSSKTKSCMRKRVVTGIILTLMVLCSTLSLKSKDFCIATVFFLLFTSWEWAALTSINKTVHSRKLFYLLSIIIAIYMSLYMKLTILILACLFWFCVLFIILCYSKAYLLSKRNHHMLLSGHLIIIPLWISFLILHERNELLLLLILSVIAISDSGAYFIGQKYGKTKITPLISPGKTLEGFIGGLLFSGTFSIICILMVRCSSYEKFVLTNLSLLVILLGLLGDVFESLVKRRYNIKDSGDILPGHGGIMDRIDSLSAAIPFFVIFLVVSKLLILC